MFKIKGILFNVGIRQEYKSYLVKKEIMVSRLGAGAYPNLVFEVLGEDIVKLDAVPLNSVVEVTFDIHGKSYTKDGQPKYINVLKVYNIEQVIVTPAVIATAILLEAVNPVETANQVTTATLLESANQVVEEFMNKKE